MSRYPVASTSSLPNIIPPQHAESKRDRKRRETVNKVELLHDESWRNRDEKFQTLYKELNNENKAINVQPPTSSKYLLRLYPTTIERDALLEAAEVDYQYKAGQAKRMYESERESIEASYWDARDQVRQRLLGAVEERRKKLREEKEGGDVVNGTLIEAQIRPRPNRRMPFSRRLSDAQSGSSTPALAHANHLLPSNDSSPNSAELALKPKDLLLHSMLAPSLAVISTDDIITPQSSSLAIIPSTNGSSFAANQAKRGPRGKPEAANADLKEIPAAPGTLTALAIASGQQQPIPVRSRNAAGAQGQWVLGKSLADLKKMESASQLEVESDWARIQGGTGRGRRTRGD